MAKCNERPGQYSVKWKEWPSEIMFEFVLKVTKVIDGQMKIGATLFDLVAKCTKNLVIDSPFAFSHLFNWPF